MPEKSLSEVLNQLRSERTACEQILAEMESLKNGEFKEVFGQAFATAMLESERQGRQKFLSISIIMPKLTSQIFKCVTILQGEFDWEIQVIIDEFPTVQSAAEFGNRKAKTLLHEQNAGYLILTDVTGSHYRIEQEQIIVSRLKQEGRGKLVVDAIDILAALKCGDS